MVSRLKTGNENRKYYTNHLLIIESEDWLSGFHCIVKDDARGRVLKLNVAEANDGSKIFPPYYCEVSAIAPLCHAPIPF